MLPLPTPVRRLRLLCTCGFLGRGLPCPRGGARMFGVCPCRCAFPPVPIVGDSSRANTSVAAPLQLQGPSALLWYFRWPLCWLPCSRRRYTGGPRSARAAVASVFAGALVADLSWCSLCGRCCGHRTARAAVWSCEIALACRCRRMQGPDVRRARQGVKHEKCSRAGFACLLSPRPCPCWSYAAGQ